MASRKKKISPSIKRMTDLRAEVEKLFSPFAVERFVWAEKVQVVSFQIEATIRLEHLKKLSRMLGTKESRLRRRPRLTADAVMVVVRKR